MSAPALRISRSHYPVTALGPGVRLGVWVQGCPLACKGCMSRDTWDETGGVEVAVEELIERWKTALADGATGLTVSGGEPLEQPGPLSDFLRLAAEVRADGNATAAGHGEPDILLYTGYELSELDQEQLAATQYADALITGRYEAGQPTDLVWRGSANQQLRPLTELGRRRYTACVDKHVASPALQLRVDGSGVWVIGVPRPGTLSRVDRALRQAGLAVDGVTWRPSWGSDGFRSSDGSQRAFGSGFRYTEPQDAYESCETAQEQAWQDGHAGSSWLAVPAWPAQPGAAHQAFRAGNRDQTPSQSEREVLPCPND